jgi:hypothetical protein
MGGQERLRVLEARLTRQLKALADRISELSYAEVEYHWVVDDATTCYLAYAHASASRISLRAQEVLDMDAEGLERTARRLTDRLDEMDLERHKPS